MKMVLCRRHRGLAFLKWIGVSGILKWIGVSGIIGSSRRQFGSSAVPVPGEKLGQPIDRMTLGMRSASQARNSAISLV
jgi:hypothetical protein